MLVRLRVRKVLAAYMLQVTEDGLSENHDLIMELRHFAKIAGAEGRWHVLEHLTNQFGHVPKLEASTLERQGGNTHQFLV